jgi:hypothetical protein
MADLAPNQMTVASALDGTEAIHGIQALNSRQITVAQIATYVGASFVEVAGDTMTGPLVITDATASTTPTTGALKVSGGLGVVGDIYCGGTISGVTIIPQNSQSTAYTTVLADGGKHLLHPSADTTARIFTIAANASVAYPLGTAITFVNQNAAGALTIAIATDTMRLAGPGTTGSRTLAANGVATALKITSTEWIISGTNLT